MAIGISGCYLLDEIDRIENPPSFNREMNNDHPFEVVDCHIFYKGKRLDFDVSIDEWVKVLGSEYRQPGGLWNLYVWDSLGFSVNLSATRKKVTSVDWLYYREPPDLELNMDPKNHINGMRGVQMFQQRKGYVPKGRFSGSIRLDGILMDDQFNIHELNQSRMAKGLNPFQESMWGNQWVHQRKCDHLGLNFSVDPNDDDNSKVDALGFGIAWIDPENGS